MEAAIRGIWCGESAYVTLIVALLLAITILSRYWEDVSWYGQIYVRYPSSLSCLYSDIAKAVKIYVLANKYLDRGITTAADYFAIMRATMKGRLRVALLDLLGERL